MLSLISHAIRPSVRHSILISLQCSHHRSCVCLFALHTETHSSLHHIIIVIIIIIISHQLLPSLIIHMFIQSSSSSSINLSHVTEPIKKSVQKKPNKQITLLKFKRSIIAHQLNSSNSFIVTY